ncbi:MAG: DUF3021 family protein [Clostridia bacterium]
MSFKVFIKRCMMEYFIITTCITAATAILGLSIDPSARFGYESYFSPLIFGFISVIPSIVTYSKKELSIKQTVIRKILHFFCLIFLLSIFGFWTGLLHGMAEIASFAFAVFLIYVIVNLVNWHLNKKEAVAVNSMLKNYQNDVRE